MRIFFPARLAAMLTAVLLIAQPCFAESGWGNAPPENRAQNASPQNPGMPQAPPQNRHEPQNNVSTPTNEPPKAGGPNGVHMHDLMPLSELDEDRVGAPNTNRPPAQSPSAPQFPQQNDQTRNPQQNELQIPGNAAEKQDYSFLEGCWETRELASYSFGKGKTKIKCNSRARFCFDGQGQGTFTGFEKSGRECSSAATADFQGSTLMLRSALAKCPGGEEFFAPRVFACAGTSSQTQCQIQATNPYRSGEVYSSRAVFRRI